MQYFFAPCNLAIDSTYYTTQFVARLHYSVTLHVCTHLRKIIIDLW